MGNPHSLERARLHPLLSVAGRSLKPLLSSSEDGEDDTVFAQYADHSFPCYRRMVRRRPWKFNYYLGSEPELFHLEEDPGETSNMAGDRLSLTWSRSCEIAR